MSDEIELGELSFKAEDFHLQAGELITEETFSVSVFAMNKANAILKEKLSKATRAVAFGTPDEYSDMWEVNSNNGSVEARLVCIKKIEGKE